MARVKLPLPFRETMAPSEARWWSGVRVYKF